MRAHGCSLSRTGLAQTADLDRGLLRLELLAAGPVHQAVIDLVVMEFHDMPAAFADREGDDAVAMAVLVRMGAGNEGVDALQPVDDTILK